MNNFEVLQKATAICLLILGTIVPLATHAATQVHLEDVQTPACIQAESELILHGQNFGDPPLQNSVTLRTEHTQLTLRTLEWRDQFIHVATPPNMPPDKGPYQLVLHVNDGSNRHAIWPKKIPACASFSTVSKQITGPVGLTQPKTSPPPVNTSPAGLSLLSGPTLGSQPLPKQPAEYQPSAPATAWEPRQVLLMSPDMTQARVLARQLQPYGYRVIRRQPLDQLDVVLSTFRIPAGQTVPEQIAALRQQAPQLLIDANHHYQLLNATETPTAKSIAIKMLNDQPNDCQPSTPRIGLLDTRVTAHAAGLDDRLHSKDFAENSNPAHPHGNQVASILASANGLLPRAEVFAADVFQRKRNTLKTNTELLLRGLNWLLQENVDVINISLGGPENRLLAHGIQQAIKRGINVAAAAGNGQNIVYPAAQTDVVAVTAVDVETHRYSSATHGNYVDLSAPGVDVPAIVDGQRKYLTGTSFAAPFVTAALARAMSNGLTAENARTKLFQHALDLGAKGRDPIYGYGLVQFLPCD